MKIFKHVSGISFIISKATEDGIEFHGKGYEEYPMELSIAREGRRHKYYIRFKDGWEIPDLATMVRNYDNPEAEIFTIANEMLITRVECEEDRSRLVKRLLKFLSDLPDAD